MQQHLFCMFFCCFDVVLSRFKLDWAFNIVAREMEREGVRSMCGRLVGDCRKPDNNSKRFYLQIMPANVDVFAIFSFALCIALPSTSSSSSFVWWYLIVCALISTYANWCAIAIIPVYSSSGKNYFCAIKTKRDTIKITQLEREKTKKKTNEDGDDERRWWTNRTVSQQLKHQQRQKTKQSAKWLRSEKTYIINVDYHN